MPLPRPFVVCESKDKGSIKRGTGTFQGNEGWHEGNEKKETVSRGAIAICRLPCNPSADNTQHGGIVEMIGTPGRLSQTWS